MPAVPDEIGKLAPSVPGLPPPPPSAVTTIPRSTLAPREAQVTYRPNSLIAHINELNNEAPPTEDNGFHDQRVQAPIPFRVDVRSLQIKAYQEGRTEDIRERRTINDEDVKDALDRWQDELQMQLARMEPNRSFSRFSMDSEHEEPPPSVGRKISMPSLSWHRKKGVNENGHEMSPTTSNGSPMSPSRLRATQTKILRLFSPKHSSLRADASTLATQSQVDIVVGRRLGRFTTTNLNKTLPKTPTAGYAASSVSIVPRCRSPYLGTPGSMRFAPVPAIRPSDLRNIDGLGVYMGPGDVSPVIAPVVLCDEDEEDGEILPASTGKLSKCKPGLATVASSIYSRDTCSSKSIVDPPPLRTLASGYSVMAGSGVDGTTSSVEDGSFACLSFQDVEPEAAQDARLAAAQHCGSTTSLHCNTRSINKTPLPLQEGGLDEASTHPENLAHIASALPSPVLTNQKSENGKGKARAFEVVTAVGERSVPCAPPKAHPTDASLAENVASVDTDVSYRNRDQSEQKTSSVQKLPTAAEAHERTPFGLGITFGDEHATDAPYSASTEGFQAAQVDTASPIGWQPKRIASKSIKPRLEMNSASTSNTPSNSRYSVINFARPLSINALQFDARLVSEVRARVNRQNEQDLTPETPRPPIVSVAHSPGGRQLVGRVEYNSSTGELFVPPNSDGEVKKTIAVHPAFREISSPINIDIDNVIKSFTEWELSSAHSDSVHSPSLASAHTSWKTRTRSDTAHTSWDTADQHIQLVRPGSKLFGEQVRAYQVGHRHH
ncbi:hypothetical protein LTR66_012265 [Elasticomyces elasticus]|nr:hypothetical protein LTR66_012265 [Elasticomyces elasticus]